MAIRLINIRLPSPPWLGLPIAPTREHISRRKLHRPICNCLNSLGDLCQGYSKDRYQISTKFRTLNFGKQQLIIPLPPCVVYASDKGRQSVWKSTSLCCWNIPNFLPQSLLRSVSPQTPEYIIVCNITFAAASKLCTTISSGLRTLWILFLRMQVS